MRKAFFGGALVAAAAVLMAGAAPAKEREVRKNSPLINALSTCRQISDPTQRLACFDKASGELVAATEKGDVSIVDRAELRQARRSLFGFNMPRLPFFSGDKSGDDLSDKLSTKVVAVRQLPHDRYQFRVQEGNALWETLESYSSFHGPKVGDPVEINRGALGSYVIRIGKQRGVKGRRIG